MYTYINIHKYIYLCIYTQITMRTYCLHPHIITNIQIYFYFILSNSSWTSNSPFPLCHIHTQTVRLHTYIIYVFLLPTIYFSLPQIQILFIIHPPPPRTLLFSSVLHWLIHLTPCYLPVYFNIVNMKVFVLLHHTAWREV